MRFVPFATSLIVALLALPAASQAQPVPSRRPPPESFGVDIVVQGVPRAPRWLGGESFIEGRLGERYVVRVHNPTWRRVEAVVSVDGRDAIDGQPAHAGTRGYVIAPYSYVDIDGFRLSMAEVAAFRFTSVPDSYAGRTGTPWTVGVIEVALFPERVQPPVRRYPAPRGAPEASAPHDRDGRDEARRGNRAQGLGTEFGETRRSPVVETSFVRENWSYPAGQVRIRYDDREGLCSRGLREFCPVRYPEPPYDPYPYSYYHNPPRRFAQPPPGWGYDR